LTGAHSDGFVQITGDFINAIGQERKFGGALRDDTRCSVTPLREVAGPD
jgi:hypothetical protein